MLGAHGMGEDMNNLVGNFTSMDGRINRQAWWIRRGRPDYRGDRA